MDARNKCFAELMFRLYLLPKYIVRYRETEKEMGMRFSILSLDRTTVSFFISLKFSFVFVHLYSFSPTVYICKYVHAMICSAKAALITILKWTKFVEQGNVFLCMYRLICQTHVFIQISEMLFQSASNLQKIVRPPESE